MWKEARYLFQKEVLLEWRSRGTIGGLLLYMLSTTFVVYLAFKQLDDIAGWNALFWIIQLFAATTGIGRVFDKDGGEHRLYLYSLASPQAVILSKILYNSLLVLIVAFIGFGLYTLLIGDPIENHTMFLLGLVLGALGFSGTFTLISGIAAQSGNNLVMTAILGFPIILPLLMTLMAYSTLAIVGADWSETENFLIVLGALNVVVVVLSTLLFPYLWRD